jgi:hypothetical protein
MSINERLVPNFTISDAAKIKIAALRSLWPSKTGENAGVLSVGWGQTTLNSGEQFEHVVIGFYAESQRPEIAHLLEQVSGLELLFFITPDNHSRFQGKVLDFTKDRSFHLV